ncbi:hypothetical protein [Hymenobacter fodinae]|nr:hypothetical protein [Hymenobacter fodinae]
MNYIILMNAFWKQDKQQPFTAAATRLYFYLLQHCNSISWTNPFQLADAYLCLGVGMNKGTLRTARESLVEADLIRYTPGGKTGRGDCAVYAIGADVLPLKVTKFNPLPDDKGPLMVAKIDPIPDPLPEEKGTEKGSKFGTTIYKEKTNTPVVENTNERAESRLGDGIELVVKSDSKNPDASASHTGAANDVATPNPFAKILFSETPFAQVVRMQELARNVDCGKAYAPHYIKQIRTKYSDEKRTLRDWKRCAVSYLTNDARSKSGLVTAPIGQSAPDDSSEVEQRMSTADKARALRRQRRENQDQ